MDRGRFAAEAAALGIAESQSLALFERLYPEPVQVWGASDVVPAPAAPDVLSRPADGFRDQGQLTRLIQVLVWLGVMLVIGAHGWWSTQGYQDLGIGLVFGLTLMWQAGFLAAAEWARREGHGSLEAGFAAVVAFYTPLTIYCIQRMAGVAFDFDDYGGFYDWVSGGWVFMEVAAIGVTVALLWRYRRPFLAFPLTMFIGFMFMDLTARLLGGTADDGAIEHVVLVGGVVIIAAAVVLDLRGWRRFAFWPHLVGIWLIAWGIPLSCGGQTWSLFVSAAIYLVLGTALARMLYLAAGGLMLWIALSISAHGAAFPFVLMFGGITFISAAIWLARSDSPMRRWLAGRQLAPQRDLAY
jgi:hypothetical protein